MQATFGCVSTRRVRLDPGVNNLGRLTVSQINHMLSGFRSGSEYKCISHHCSLQQLNTPVWATPHWCRWAIPSKRWRNIRFTVGTGINAPWRASRASSTLPWNKSITKQRCSPSSSIPWWMKWVARRAKWLGCCEVMDDKHCRTSNSRSLCSWFSCVAYPLRILIATCLFSLQW